jgi:hypothetical protein
MFFALVSIYLIFLGYVARTIDRTHIELVLVCFSVSFVLYFLIFSYINKKSSNLIFYLAIALRLVVLFVYPALSDDYFRFLWDGYLVSLGENPFAFTPLDWMHKHPNLDQDITFIYEHLNSKNYYSVYSILLQMIFTLPWVFGITKLIYQIALLQGILFLFELGSLWFLKNAKLKPTIFWLYAGNPIIILESVSQIHPEAIICFLLIVMLYLIRKKAIIFSNIIFACIFQVKLNFLFLLPAFVVYTKSRNLISLGISVVVSILALSFSVFFNLSSQLKNGLGLFFHSFRFHSLFEQVFYLGLNLFPAYQYLSGTLSMIVGALFYIYMILKFDLCEEVKILLGLLLILVVSPVLHSWYILPFFGLAIYTGYHVKLAVILSIFSALSYLLYGTQNQYFIASLTILEIIILGFYLWKNKLLSFLQKTPYLEK